MSGGQRRALKISILTFNIENFKKLKSAIFTLLYNNINIILKAPNFVSKIKKQENPTGILISIRISNQISGFLIRYPDI